jgi:hypothetical protein
MGKEKGTRREKEKGTLNKIEQNPAEQNPE